jgi:hypothetical protein
MPGCLLTPLFVVLALVWCVFPAWGIWPFIGLEVLTLLWPLTALPQARRAAQALQERAPGALADDEWAYLRRHALLFIWPMTTRSLSGTVSAIQLLGIPVGLVLLIRRAWMGVAVCLVNYLFLGFVAKLLCPMQFVADGYRKDPAFWADEKRKLDRAIAFAQTAHAATEDVAEPDDPGNLDQG